jgi:hypothetical protein
MKSNLLREAVRIAYDKHSSHPMKSRGYCLYSFVVERSKILGFGVNNRDRVLPKHFGYDARMRGWDGGFVTAEHAEISAWRKCRGLIEDTFELINIRITDGGNLANSASCSCCVNWLKENGCTHVHFTTASHWAKMKLV